MKLTAQEEYGLRCILTLARQELRATDVSLPGSTDVANPSGAEVTPGDADGPVGGARRPGPLAVEDCRNSEVRRPEAAAGTREPDRGASGDAALTIAQMAEREGISEQYAGKLIRILGKAGLVASVRGRNGGYHLARDPSEIDVGEILRALGGNVYDDELCGRYSGDRRFCVHTNDCSIRSLWSGVQSLIDRVLSTTHLSDLVGSERVVDRWMQNQLVAVEDLRGGFVKQAGLSPSGEPSAGVQDSNP